MAITKPSAPSRFLKGTVAYVGPDSNWTYDDGTNDQIVGKLYRIIYDIAITPTAHSSDHHKSAFGGREYNGMDVRIGDWISSENAGRALRIVDIINMQETSIRVVAEDTGLYNMMQDSSGNANARLLDSTGSGVYIFEVDENMVPKVHNLPLTPAGSLNSEWPALITSRFASWREEMGIYRRQVGHGLKKGQLLRLAKEDEIVTNVAVGTIAPAQAAPGNQVRINSTTITFEAFSNTDDIVAFMNQQGIDNGYITASNIDGYVGLTATDGRDIYVTDVGSSITNQYGIGLFNAGDGVFEGKFVAIGDDDDDPIAIVTELGPDPDTFYFQWLGKVIEVDNDVVLPGNIGDTLYLTEKGRYTSNPTISSNSVMVKYVQPKPTVLRGKIGGSSSSGNAFALNKVVVNIGGSGTVDDAVTGILAAAIPNITARNSGGALVIENEAGGDIAIWDDIAGDITTDYGIRNLTMGTGNTKVVVLDRPSVPSDKVIYPTIITGVDGGTTTVGAILEIVGPAETFQITFEDPESVGGITATMAAEQINADPNLNREQIFADVSATDALIIKSLVGDNITIQNGSIGTAATNLFGDIAVEGTTTSAHGQMMEVSNLTGSTLERGQVVKLTGFSNSGEFNVVPVATVDDTAFGVVIADIADMTSGKVMINGLVSTDINTSSAQEGDPVFFDAAGKLTLTVGSKKIGSVYQLGTNAQVFITLTSGSGGGLEAVQDDTNPVLGGDVNVNGFEIFSENSEDIVLNPRGTGHVVVDGTGNGAIQSFFGLDLTMKAGDGTDTEDGGDLILEGGNGFNSTASGDVILRGGVGGGFDGRVIINNMTFPDVDGTNEQVLATDGTGNLYWRDAASGSGGGDAGVLGIPTDGDLTDGRSGKLPAITSWVSGTTTVTDAVDGLNEILGLLVPPMPDELSTKTLSMSGGANSRSGSQIVLASGVTDNTGGFTPAAGVQIYRIGSANASTATVADFASGNSGTLTALVNGVADGVITLDENNNTGSDLSLTISANGDYPIDQPGFWQSLSAKVSSTVVAGVNMFEMEHSETGKTNQAIFTYDTLNSAPTVSGQSLSETTPGTLQYSSGVPHYPSGAVLAASGTVSALAGNTYLSTNVIQVGSSPSIGTTVSLNPGQSGIPSPMALDQVPVSIAGEAFTVGGNVHATSQLYMKGRNPYGDSSNSNFSEFVNVMSGNPSPSASGPVMEMNVLVESGLGSGTGNAGRIVMNGTDTPADDKSALTAPDWDSNSEIASYDAAVVGGILKNDATDYSFGYFPAGPDYSFTQDPDQYVTFMFRRSAVSQFKIQINGSYAGMWVKLPGVDGGTAPNGWWDMTELYKGNGVPGSNGGNGCALGSVATGSSGTFTCTFGTETSSNAANNIILVRLKLTSGQSVSGLAFKKV